MITNEKEGFLIMAGTYPDVPAARIAYDKDGSVGISVSSTNQATILTPAQLASINNESTTTSFSLASTNYSVVIMFAQTMTIYGVFHAVGASSDITYISTDTSNGVDGTWTIYRSTVSNTVLSPNYRSAIYTSPSPVSNVKAIKLTSTYSYPQSLYCLHVYGVPSAYSGDKLAFWHPSLDQPLNTIPAYFDYGDVPQNSPAYERNFRLKNLSTTLSANSITVSCEAPTDSSPTTYVSQTAFRYDGGSYGATASMATLSPGEISPIFTARLQVLPTATLSLWTQRYIAEAANWS